MTREFKPFFFGRWSKNCSFLSLTCLLPHLCRQLFLLNSSVLPSSNDQPQLREELWRFGSFETRLSVLCPTSITLPNRFVTPMLINKETSSNRRLKLKRNKRENNGTRTLLDCSRSKSKCFVVGHHFHTICVRVPARVRALAVSNTTLVVPHLSEPGMDGVPRSLAPRFPPN